METRKSDGEIVWSAIKIGLAIALIISVLFGSFYTVKAGTRGVLLTFGEASTDAKGEGLHLKLPFIQKVVKMDVQTQKYETPASAASKDLQTVTSTIAVNYHLVPELVPEMYRNVGYAYEAKIIQPAIQEVIKATTAKFTAEEIITKREQVTIAVADNLREKLNDRGLIVENINLVNFDFSASFNNAIEAKVTAEQLKLKAERDLERIKVEAEQAQAEAIGKKNAAIANAQGQAEAIRIINEQLSRSPKYIDYLAVTEWDGVLPKVTGGAIPLISIE